MSRADCRIMRATCVPLSSGRIDSSQLATPETNAAENDVPLAR